MNAELIKQLQTVQQELEPRVKAVRNASSALKEVTRLASQEKADALPMQKALLKLEQALDQVQAEGLEYEGLQAATSAFRAVTNEALDALAFDFARDLKETFEAQGITVDGRPPVLVVDPLVLQINIGERKAQWFYGKEPLTRALALSLGAITTAYDQQRRRLLADSLDPALFLRELYDAWNQLMEQRTRRPAGGRINIIETYSKLVLNRQNARFWNAPSRATFRDYERAFFVRDLGLARKADPIVDVDGKRYRLRLGVATKNQAEQVSRSIWLPSGPLDGEYYSDLMFEEA